MNFNDYKDFEYYKSLIRIGIPISCAIMVEFIAFNSIAIITGRNFQGQEYTDYIRHIAIGSMGFSPGIIEHCRDGEVAGKGTIPNV